MNRGTLITQLIVDEGQRLSPYVDTVGKMTIGVGRNLTDRGISASESLVLLNNDIDGAVADLNRQCPWWTTLTDSRQNVLLNMCFNLGIDRLLKFKNMLLACEAGNYLGAAQEMMDSEWARQVGARAVRLSAAMKGGI